MVKKSERLGSNRFNAKNAKYAIEPFATFSVLCVFALKIRQDRTQPVEPLIKTHSSLLAGLEQFGEQFDLLFLHLDQLPPLLFAQLVELGVQP